MLNQGSCEERLSKARHVMEVLTTRPEVATLLGIHASCPEELERGWSLYRTALAAAEARTVERSVMIGAIEHCTTLFQAARIAQARLTALARVMISAAPDRDRLGLSGRRAESLAAWRCQAEVFHANLSQADRQLLLRVGVDDAELAEAKARLDQLAMAHAACIAAKAEAKAATARKAEAMAAMASYLSVLIGIVRALEPEHPTLLSLLGMKLDGRRRPPRLRQEEPTSGMMQVAAAARPTDQGSAYSTATGKGRDQRSKQGRRSVGKKGRKRRFR